LPCSFCLSHLDPHCPQARLRVSPISVLRRDRPQIYRKTRKKVQWQLLALR
jgi:hypothetical protein